MGNTIMSDMSNEQIQLIRRAQRWKMAFLGTVILIAGIVIGAGSALIFGPDSHNGIPHDIEFLNERIIRSLHMELQLDPAQTEQVNAILETRLNQLHEIRRQARPKIAEVMNDLYTEVLEVLDEQQREIWRNSIERLRNQLTHPDPAGRRLRGGPGGPGRQMGPGGPPGSFGGPGHAPPHRPFDFWEHPRNPNRFAPPGGRTRPPRPTDPLTKPDATSSSSPENHPE